MMKYTIKRISTITLNEESSPKNIGIIHPGIFNDITLNR